MQPAPSSRNDDVPLSFNQEARLVLELWARKRSMPRPPFHVLLALRLTGPVNAGALDGALNEIVRRHDVFRTSVAIADGRAGGARRALATLTVHPQVTVRVQHAALADLAPEAQRLALLEIAAREFDTPFDYGAPPLLRATLVRRAPAEHVLILVVHHLMCDGWSLGLLRRELETLYDAFSRGRPSPLPPLQHQFADFAEWERARARSGAFEASLVHWTRRWSESQSAVVDVRDLPFAGPATSAGGAVAAPETVTIDGIANQRLRQRARKAGVTLHTLCLAALALLLHAYTRKTRIAVWTPFANRGRREFEPLIGWFANSYMLGIDLAPDRPVAQLLRDVSGVMLDASAHQDLPLMLLFERLTHRDGPLRASPTRLDRTQISFDLTRQTTSRAGDIQISRESLAPAPQELGFHLLAVDRDRELALRLRYPADVEGRHMQRMLVDLRGILDTMISAPDTLISRVHASG